MSARPPVPRRLAPPTPTEDVKPSGQARIPPSLPPRGRVVTPNNINTVPDLTRLLARKPPPPPLPAVASKSRTPPLVVTPRRGMVFTPFTAAMQTAPPTPPPVNFASKPTFNLDSLAEAEPEPASELMSTASSCLQCRDFSTVDAHAASFPRHTVRSVEELAYALAEPFTAEIDKARVAFTWLHYNIAYDADAFFSGNLQPSTAESTLASGLAVCDGYAGLYERLLDLMGLQAYKVTGHGKGYGYQALADGEPLPEMKANHAWNCIYVDGEWHLVDPCWGSGHLDPSGVYNAKFAPQWFISSPTQFGMRHFPEDPSFQLTSKEVTWEQYILAPEAPPIPAIVEELGLDPLTIQPSTKYIPERQFVTFCLSKRCVHMSTAEEDNYVLVIKTEKEFTPMCYDETQGAWVATVFIPRAGTVHLYAVDTIDGINAFGVGLAAYSKAKGRKGMSYKGLVAWTIAHL